MVQVSNSTLISQTLRIVAEGFSFMKSAPLYFFSHRALFFQSAQLIFAFLVSAVQFLTDHSAHSILYCVSRHCLT